MTSETNRPKITGMKISRRIGTFFENCNENCDSFENWTRFKSSPQVDKTFKTDSRRSETVEFEI